MQLLRNKHHQIDPLWHVHLVLAITVLIQLFIPNKLSAFPRYIIPALIVACMIALQIVTPKVATFNSTVRRVIVFLLIGLMAVANTTSLQLLLAAMLKATSEQAPALLISATGIYFTNLVVFGLLYWEMDEGGPGQRRKPGDEGQDFLFPQQSMNIKWHPTFFDYLYVSLTNGTAFSPTDTMPLSRRAKFVMGLQALLSIIIVVLIAARAINIL